MWSFGDAVQVRGSLVTGLEKKRDISVLVFFRLMNVLDSTFRDEHFGIDNPEIREHYVH